MRRKTFAVLFLLTIGMFSFNSYIGGLISSSRNNVRRNAFTKLRLANFENVDTFTKNIFNGRNSHTFEESYVPIIELLKALKCSTEQANAQYNVNKWINITESGNEMVYSAYKDDTEIRIFGATLTRRASTAWFCNIWYKKGNRINVTTIGAKLSIIPDYHSRT